MMIKYYIAVFLGALLTVTAQLLLKKGALNKKNNLIADMFLNKYIVSGYFIFVMVTVLNLFALKEIPLIFMVIINPLVLILVVFFSMLLFKEKINKKQLKGLILILTGIIIFNLNF